MLIHGAVQGTPGVLPRSASAGESTAVPVSRIELETSGASNQRSAKLSLRGKKVHSVSFYVHTSDSHGRSSGPLASLTRTPSNPLCHARESNSSTPKRGTLQAPVRPSAHDLKSCVVRTGFEPVPSQLKAGGAASYSNAP